LFPFIQTNTDDGATAQQKEAAAQVTSTVAKNLSEEAKIASSLVAELTKKRMAITGVPLLHVAMSRARFHDHPHVITNRKGINPCEIMNEGDLRIIYEKLTSSNIDTKMTILLDPVQMTISMRIPVDNILIRTNKLARSRETEILTSDVFIEDMYGEKFRPEIKCYFRPVMARIVYCWLLDRFGEYGASRELWDSTVTSSDKADIGNDQEAHRARIQTILTGHRSSTPKQLWDRMGERPFTDAQMAVMKEEYSESEVEYVLLSKTRELNADVADENAYKRIASHYAEVHDEKDLELDRKDRRVTIDVSRRL
jgi:hypothetical protein